MIRSSKQKYKYDFIRAGHYLIVYLLCPWRLIWGGDQHSGCALFDTTSSALVGSHCNGTITWCRSFHPKAKCSTFYEALCPCCTHQSVVIKNKIKGPTLVIVKISPGLKLRLNHQILLTSPTFLWPVCNYRDRSMAFSTSVTPCKCAPAFHVSSYIALPWPT